MVWSKLLHPGRQDGHRPCGPRVVCERVAEATGVQAGGVGIVGRLLGRHPEGHRRCWTPWILGSIPWQRQTVTPASVLRRPRRVPVFEGRVAACGGA